MADESLPTITPIIRVVTRLTAIFLSLRTLFTIVMTSSVSPKDLEESRFLNISGPMNSGLLSKLGRAGNFVSRVGQGTWNIEKDTKLAIAALRRGLELGLNHIDTAEMYGSGRSEQIVGQAIHGQREEVFLVSKVLPSNASYEGTIRVCEKSLKNLQTDYLDMYLLHWRGNTPLAETFRAFRQLVDQGKIRSFGVSNFDVDDIKELLEVADASQIASNQVLYHLQERAIEFELLPWCQKQGIPVVAYSPFGQGDFPKADSVQGTVLSKIAQRHGKTPRQVALAFLLRHEDVFVIPKTVHIDRVEENAGALGFVLDSESLQEIESAFPAKRKSHLPML